MLGAPCSPCCDPCTFRLETLPESIELNINVSSAPEHYSSSRWVFVKGGPNTFLAHSQITTQSAYATTLTSVALSLAKQAGSTATSATYIYTDTAMTVRVDAATTADPNGPNLLLSVNANRVAISTGNILTSFRINRFEVVPWIWDNTSNCVPVQNSADRNSEMISQMRSNRMPTTTQPQMQALLPTLSSTETRVGPEPEMHGSLAVFNSCTPTYFQIAASGASAATSLVCPGAATAGGVYDDWTFGTTLTPSATPRGYPLNVTSGGGVNRADVIVRNNNDRVTFTRPDCGSTLIDSPGYAPDGTGGKTTTSALTYNSALGVFVHSLWPGFAFSYFTAGTFQNYRCAQNNNNAVLVFDPFTMYRAETIFARQFAISDVVLLFSDGSSLGLS